MGTLNLMTGPAITVSSTDMDIHSIADIHNEPNNRSIMKIESFGSMDELLLVSQCTPLFSLLKKRALVQIFAAHDG